MSSTLIFYLCVEFIAVSLLACADCMVSGAKRNLIQSGGAGFSFYRKFDIKSYHLCFLVSFLVLFLVLALRDHVGTDYGAYVRIYSNINDYGLEDGIGRIELGFAVLCRIAGIFVPRSYLLMFAVMAFLTMYFLYKSIYKMSCCWYLSLFIYISTCFLYNSMNQIRQALAMMITVYAWHFLFERENRKFFLLYVLLAGLVHRSAYFMILFYPLSHIQMTKKNLLIYALIFVSLNSSFIINAITYVASFTKYKGYIDSMQGTVLQSTIAVTYLRVCMIICSLLFVRKTIARNPNALVYYNAAIVCLLITRTATVTTVPIFSRLSSYFFMSYIFLVPEVLKTIKDIYSTKYDKGFFVFSTILLYFSYHFVYFFMSGYVIRSVVPYKTWLFS